MRSTRFTVSAAAAMVLSLLLTSATLASGPITRHRGTVTAVCGGQTYTVSVENGGQNIGAAQVVDAFGHAILVHGTSTVTDERTGAVLGSWVSAHGSGHANQTQTTCVSIVEYTTAVAFGGGPMPGGVLPGDIIRYEVDFSVVLKV